MSPFESPPSQLDEFIAPIIGQPVWGAEQGYGSFLSLQFGSPRLIVKEWRSATRGQRRQAYVRGDWCVWIYCCEWRLSMHGDQIAWSEDTREEIARATGMLNGQKITGIQASQLDGRSTFRFDLGGLLETWPVGDDPTEEQWFIYSSDEVFGFRADGHFSRQLPSTPREQERWSPLG
jgi:hypothetical protein